VAQLVPKGGQIGAPQELGRDRNLKGRFALKSRRERERGGLLATFSPALLPTSWHLSPEFPLIVDIFASYSAYLVPKLCTGSGLSLPRWHYVLAGGGGVLAPLGLVGFVHKVGGCHQSSEQVRH